MGKDSDYGEPGDMRTGGEGPLTVGEVRNALHGLDADVVIDFGSTRDAVPLKFYRFKWRGEMVLQMELSEDRD